MKTRTINVYSFDELSEKAQEKALEKLWDINVNYDWSELTIDDFKAENSKYFCIEKVYFSGFSSQGDGAMFEYSGINREFVNSIIEELPLPNWKKNVLKACTLVTGNGTQRGHYYHYNSCDHNIYIESDNGAQYYRNIELLIDSVSATIENEITDKYKELSKGLYRTLEKEYEYLTSEAAIKESIEANEYEFDEYGNLI